MVSPSTSSTNGSVVDVTNAYTSCVNGSINGESIQNAIQGNKSAADIFLEEVESLSNPAPKTNETIIQLDHAAKYKEPDPFDGVMERVNGFLSEIAPEYDMSRKIMDELMSKLKRYSENESCMFSRTNSQASMSDLLNMVNIGTGHSILPQKNQNSLCVPPSSPSLSNTSMDVLAPPSSPASTFDESSMKSVVDTTCQICHMGPFASSQSMIRHVQRKHPDQLDSVKVKFRQTNLPFACPICHKSFAVEASLRTHLRRHESEKTHKCPICPDRAYILASELRKHIKKSHESKNEDRINDQTEKSETTSNDSLQRSTSVIKNTQVNGLQDMPEFL